MISDDRFFSGPAIKLRQPLADVYLVSIPAKKLAAVTFSDPFTEGDREFRGIQRIEIEQRKKDLSQFIQSKEAAFPTTVILGANYNKKGLKYRAEEGEIDESWRIEPLSSGDIFDGNLYNLIIPTDGRLASIIDGQHRISGFRRLIDELAIMDIDIDIPCAVYMDLSLAEQAYLFATVNSTQKKVDKSLAYELFGFALNEGESSQWSPEKLAIYLTRKLNNENDSPFYRHIPPPNQSPDRKRGGELKEYLGVEWIVSTATVVDSILRLISRNPSRDRDKINLVSFDKKARGVLDNDNSPLRLLYTSSNDRVIYEIIKNFFISFAKYVWDKNSSESYIFKTVGIQASFDLLGSLAYEAVALKKSSVEYFDEKLKPLDGLIIDDNYFQASGIGRSRILNILSLKVGLKKMDSVNKKALPDLIQYLARSGIKIDGHSPQDKLL